jgi:thiamine kinase-like enzyme
MPNKPQHSHQQEVQTFLQKYFSAQPWTFTFPHGRGHESYFAYGNSDSFYIKLNAVTDNYQAMAALGLTPQVLLTGCLEDGTSIMVQPVVAGRKPLWKDFHQYLEKFAATIRTMHHSLAVRQVLLGITSDRYCDLGAESLARLKRKWEQYKTLVPAAAGFVDESLALLAEQIQGFTGAGCVASHNDICNANWLITADERVYLIDLDAMSLDDPALDLGAILWWYYPPELRPKFLEIAGCVNDKPFQERMRVRMAMHCLHILLPREGSFDQFDPNGFDEALMDFRAVVAGKENPQGYGDVSL